MATAPARHVCPCVRQATRLPHDQVVASLLMELKAGLSNSPEARERFAAKISDVEQSLDPHLSPIINLLLTLLNSSVGPYRRVMQPMWPMT